MSVQLFVTEVTQSQSPNGEFITIQHGTDNAVSKSKINAEVFPHEFMQMIGDMNDHFKTICELGADVNYAITGFKIRDAKSGNQEIQFVVNIRTEYVYFENAKTDWLEIREIDMSQIGGSSIAFRSRAHAINGLIEKFNELQGFIRDNIADWLEMEVPQPLSLFDRPNLAAQEKFAQTLQNIADKNNASVSTSVSTSVREIKFEPKNNPEDLKKQLSSMQ